MARPVLRLVKPAPEVKAGPKKSKWRWDNSTLRYHNVATGRFMSRRVVLSLLNRRITSAQLTIGRVTEAFVNGRIDLAEWQRLMAEQIKFMHTHSAALGRGGWEKMTNADWGRVGGNLRFQYSKLTDFAQAIKQGKLTPAQIQARAGMYGSSGWSPYWRTLTTTAREAGFVEERRVLDPEAEHCENCEDYARRGWMPIGSLPEPGEDSQCLTNCRCRKEYRRPEEMMM